MNTADVLRRPADRISKPGAWTQGVMARSASGDPTILPRYAHTAVAWCAIGAISAEAPTDFLCRDAQLMAERLVPGHDLVRYNDRKGQKVTAVARLLRKAADDWESADKEEPS